MSTLNITLNKPTATRSVIAISVKEDDYQPSIDLKLKEIARETSMPGFRPGKVPTGVLQKRYGKTLLIEKVNSLVSESLNNYIKEQDFRMVGEPVPIHDADAWDTKKDFDFEFEIGLIEDFTIDLSPAVSIPQYIAVVDEPMINSQVDALRKHHSAWEASEVSQASDTLTGYLEMEGQEKKAVSMSLTLFSEEEVKPFLGLKVKEKHTLEVAQLPESEQARANILVLPIEEVKGVAGGSFTLAIDTISRPKPAELNEEFFATVFPGSEIKTEEEFRAKVKESLLAESEKDSLLRLNHRIQEYFTKHTSITLPEEFMRKWIRSKHPTISEEGLEKEVSRMLRLAKWGAIVGDIAKKKPF